MVKHGAKQERIFDEKLDPEIVRIADRYIDQRKAVKVAKEKMDIQEQNLIGETEYKRLYDEISSHDARMNNLFLALDEHLIDLHRNTPWGFITWKCSELRETLRRGWYRLKKRVM